MKFDQPAYSDNKIKLYIKPIEPESKNYQTNVRLNLDDKHWPYRQKIEEAIDKSKLSKEMHAGDLNGKTRKQSGYQEGKYKRLKWVKTNAKATQDKQNVDLWKN